MSSKQIARNPFIHQSSGDDSKATLVSILLTILLLSLSVRSQTEEPLLEYETPENLSGALYLDPWHIEKEILISPTVLGQFADSEVLPDTPLSLEKRQKLKNLLTTRFQDLLPLTYDGKTLAFEPEQTRFIRPNTAELIPIADEETVPASQTIISLTYSAALPHPGGQVNLTWDLFPANITNVNLLVADDIGTRTIPLTPETPDTSITPRLAQNSDKLPLPPPLPENLTLRISWLTILLAIPLLLLAIKTIRSGEATPARLIALLALTSVAAASQRLLFFEINNPFAARNSMNDSEGKIITHDLLRNVYHAFDFREEDTQYEILRRVTADNTLTDVYLEARRTLLQRQQNGSRVRVTALAVTEAKIIESDPRDGFTARSQWTTSGKVGHWGHFHQRTNNYHADLRIAPRDGSWKLVSLELISADRQQ